MSTLPDNEFDSQLLDLHLGRLPEHERIALEQRISGDPALARQNEAVAAMFAALGRVRASKPVLPAGLTERIATRVAAAGPPRRDTSPRRPTVADLVEEEGARVIRLHSLREIAAVAAMIVLAVGLGVPSLLHMRERGQRVVCSEQLRNIGHGMQAYALASSGSLPFAGWNSNDSWRPTDEPGLNVLPNRVHVYRLLRSRQVPARVFVCPSTNGLPMPDDQVPQQDDFLESRNLSYAYQNMAGVRPSLQDHSDLPLLGDDNPFFDDGWPLFAVTRNLGLSDPANTNSRAHGGGGQNILTIGGEVKWMTTPNAGIDHDNIWTLQGVSDYTGREGPKSPTDSHLLK